MGNQGTILERVAVSWGVQAAVTPGCNPSIISKPGSLAILKIALKTILFLLNQAGRGSVVCAKKVDDAIRKVSMVFEWTVLFPCILLMPSVPCQHLGHVYPPGKKVALHAPPTTSCYSICHYLRWSGRVTGLRAVPWAVWLLSPEYVLYSPASCLWDWQCCGLSFTTKRPTDFPFGENFVPQHLSVVQGSLNAKENESAGASALALGEQEIELTIILTLF